VPPAAGTRGDIRPSFKAWSTDYNWDIQEKLVAFAESRGWALPQMSLAWLLTRPQMSTVIAGADKPEHVLTNVKALEVKFTPKDLKEIDRLTVFPDDRTLPPVFDRPTGR
jgi:aryl-alcohol dehydrogenase-like predicted oxidoreductase